MHRRPRDTLHLLLPYISSTETLTDAMFDSMLLCITDATVIRNAIERSGTCLTAETFNRALFWENPAGVKELLDHDVPISDDIGDYVRAYNRSDIFGDRDDVLRALLSHPRINPAEFDAIPECRRVNDVLSRERTMHRTSRIKRELMAATWTPDRHVAWCLEHDFFASSNDEN
jgi:hypothetical protein